MSSRLTLPAVALAVATAGSAFAQNDECTGAIAIGVGATAYNTTGATTSFGWPCAAGGNDLWYSYTSTGANTQITIETCGSAYDTAIEVFSGNCAALASVVCNDDAGGNGPCSFTLQSFVSFPSAGGTYYIRVGGFNGNTGAGVINLSEAVRNDECATALPIGAGSTPYTNVGSSTSFAWPCAAGGNDVWYTYATSGNGAQVTINTCGSGYDTSVEVFSGNCAGLASVVCNDDSGGNGPCAGTLQSFASFVSAGGTYYIRVGGFNSNTGSGFINISDVPPPVNVDLAIVDCIAGSFVDISGTGTALNLSDDGSASISTTVGNALLAAGSARVGSNGAVRFAGTGTSLGFTNGTIPNAGAFGLNDQVLMAFWDDVNTVGGTVGNIYWQEIGSTLYVQWANVGFFGQPATERATFQLQVHASGPALAQFIYTDVQGTRAGRGSSATIGYQDGGVGAGDAQYSFDAVNAVRNGAVVSLVNRQAATTYISSTLPGTWIEIAGTGTPLNLTDDGSAAIATTVGNGLLAAGAAQVGSNGAVRIGGTGTSLGFTNAAIPSASAFGLTSQVLMPFWDDVNTVGGTVGNIFWQQVGSTLVVQWDDVGFFGGAATDRATFQVQVFRGGPLVAQFLYQDVQGVRAASGASATIGYQAGGVAGNNVQWSFNTASVSNGSVLSICYTDAVVGTKFCLTNNNSTGVSGNMFGTGSNSVVSNNLVLHASSLPLNANGYFITSTTSLFIANPGGSLGNLCLAGSIGRYIGPGQVQNSGSSGSFSLAVNLFQHPTPTGPIAVLPGETWNFQTWHRDSVGGVSVSNFTSAIQIQFTN
jgi:hypothetical protein